MHLLDICTVKHGKKNPKTQRVTNPTIRRKPSVYILISIMESKHVQSQEQQHTTN